MFNFPKPGPNSEYGPLSIKEKFLWILAHYFYIFGPSIRHYDKRDKESECDCGPDCEHWVCDCILDEEWEGE